VSSWTFDGEAYPVPPADDDFTGNEIYDVVSDGPRAPLPGYLISNPAINVNQAQGLNWLWTAARSEWP
jgi:hypothetical protein